MERAIQLRVNWPKNPVAHCLDCEGRGHRWVHLCYGGEDAIGGTLTSSRPCKTCGGSGRLRGFHPPV